MSTGGLELNQLGRLVAAERGRRGFSLRDAAQDTGIPLNTLARVEKGNIPDLRKFKRLAEWCGADIRQFLEPPEKPAAVTTEMIAELLRGDRNLAPEAAERMIRIINELYQILVRPQEVFVVHLGMPTALQPGAEPVLAPLLRDLREALLT